MTDILEIGSDNDLYLDDVTLHTGESTTAVQTTGSGTCQIQETDGTAVGSAVTLSHDAAGFWWGTFPAATAATLDEDRDYHALYTFTAAGGQIKVIRRTMTAKYSQGD